MMKDWPLILVTHQASIFLTAVLEYLVAEMLQLAGNCSRDTFNGEDENEEEGMLSAAPSPSPSGTDC
jgi:hypothetical protein